MDRELSGCMSVRKRRTAEPRHLDPTKVQAEELQTSSTEKRASHIEAGSHLLFAKPYYWPSLSESIECNHHIDNLRFIALCAQKPLKDRVYKRYHNMQSIQEMIHGQFKEQSAELKEPQSLGQGEFQPVPSQGEFVRIDESLVFRESMNQLLSLATQNKANSMVLQSLAGHCSAECAAKLSLLVRQHHRKLICDRYGSYLVQAMVKRDRGVQQVVEETTTSEFASMVHNEYSSRVMQRLIEISDTFRTFVMDSFKKHMGIFIQSVSACYLISVGILNSQSESERDVVSGYLNNKAVSWHTNKYFKKILICYLSSCSEDRLNSMYKKLFRKRSLLWYLSEKYACLVLLKFIERNHQLTKELVFSKLEKDPFAIIRLSYFGFFIGELIRSDPVHGLGSAIYRRLTSMTRPELLRLYQNCAVFQIYSGSVSITHGLGKISAETVRSAEQG
jgi:hypothetical protein